MLLGPRADGLELARRPDERTVERAVVRVAVGGDPVAGGDHVVEAEPVGERLDEVVRGRGGEHERAALGAVLLEHAVGERLHHRHQPVGDAVGGGQHRRPRPALGERHRLPRQRHRRQRLADRVEQREQEALARDRAADETGRAHRLAEHLATGAAQQRSVEVEECRTRLLAR